MQTSKGLLVVVVLGCLLGSISAGPYAGNPPSEDFWKTADRIYDSWGNFMSFKQTEDAIKEVLKGMESIPIDKRQPTYNDTQKDYQDLLRFNKGDCGSCGEVIRDIEKMMGKMYDFENGLGHANYRPYLEVCRLFQRSYCVSCTSIGKPDDVITEATQYQGLLGGKMPRVDYECDANCLAKELQLPMFANTKQVEELLHQAHFREALRAIYSEKEYLTHDYYAPSLRLALAELERVQTRDGRLDGSLGDLKHQIELLLDVCTPAPTKCANEFKEFTALMKLLKIDNYKELLKRESMKNYAKDCLVKMKYYCSYFEYPDTSRFPVYKE